MMLNDEMWVSIRAFGMLSAIRFGLAGAHRTGLSKVSQSALRPSPLGTLLFLIDVVRFENFSSAQVA